MNQSDIIIKQLLNLDIKEIESKKYINKKYTDIINSDELWEDLISRDFNININKDNLKEIYNKINIIEKINTLKGIMISLNVIKKYDIESGNYDENFNEKEAYYFNIENNYSLFEFSDYYDEVLNCMIKLINKNQSILNYIMDNNIHDFDKILYHFLFNLESINNIDINKFFVYLETIYGKNNIRKKLKYNVSDNLNVNEKIFCQIPSDYCSFYIKK